MSEDMREHPRFPIANTVFIELESAEFGSRDPGIIVRGTTHEIARDGLRVSLQRPLPVNAILQLAVELPAGAGTHYLVGEVRWCHPLPGTEAEPAWHAGMALFNADGSDFEDWRALVTLLES